jgi:hypothetical protein
MRRNTHRLHDNGTLFLDLPTTVSYGLIFLYIIVSSALSYHSLLLLCCSRNAMLLIDFAQNVAGSVSLAGELAPCLRDGSSALSELRRSD